MDSVPFAQSLCTIVLDLMPSAVIIVDENSAVLYSNARARNILEGEDGLRLMGGQLSAVDAQAATGLRRAVKDCAAAGSYGVAHVDVLSIPRDRSRLPLLLRLAPTAKGAPVLVFVGDPECGTAELDIGLLQRLHGLTEREAQLTSLLAQGNRIPQAATAMGITYNTARDHLRSVLSKTRVTSQVDLLRLIWASPVWPA